MERIAISIRETSETLGLGRTTIYKLINDGSLSMKKVGRRSLVMVSSIERLLDTDGFATPGAGSKNG